MPVIHFDVRELERLLGDKARGKADRDQLRDLIPMLGADIDKADGDAWAVEFFPDRPDLFTVEGIARALRAYLGDQPGLRKYTVAKAKPKDVLRVDASVKDVRPIIRGAVVTGLTFTDARIQALMELQEDLHHGVGARRRKASVGVHDMAQLKGPFTYKAVGLDEVAFVPLQGKDKMTPRDILAKHAKGQAFAHLVGERAPLLVDAEDQVLSFPPIINGTLTTVTEATKDVFVDVTGLDERAVTKALNLVVTTLAEQGGKVQAVTVHEGRKKIASPDLTPETWTLQASEVERLLGVALKPTDIAAALKRMGHGATPPKASAKSAKGARTAKATTAKSKPAKATAGSIAAAGKLTVEVPCYRTDVLHEVDLIEDVAIGHGYANFSHARPELVTYGKASQAEQRGALAREVLLGLGFTEVMTLSLTSDALEGEAFGLPMRPAVKVANPVTEEHTHLRTTLLASLFHVLEKNVHRPYPQAVFEVGDVVWSFPAPDGKAPGMPVNARMVGLVKVHSKASFSEAKSVALALARDLGLPTEVHPLDPADPFANTFIAGRAAVLGAKDDPWGWFGEVAPATLTAFQVGQPAIAMEFKLDAALLQEV